MAHQSEIDNHTFLSKYFDEHLNKIDKKLSDKTSNLILIEGELQRINANQNPNNSHIEVLNTEIKDTKSSIIDMFQRKAHMDKQKEYLNHKISGYKLLKKNASDS